MILWDYFAIIGNYFNKYRLKIVLFCRNSGIIKASLTADCSSC